ncbi:hypothetical protein KEM54_003017 [Ascosphaera aggregata]|nr:hypothetical protein KEM54_003017 [Ascosphaera aggregata]
MEMKRESDTVRPLHERKCSGPAQTLAETSGKLNASTTAAIGAASAASAASVASVACAACAACAPPTKKRRRNRKINPDTKYACTYAGCTKSYSRAEHLQRHRLNHEPRRIYYCSYPGCRKQFVRQDLCVRHRERHSALPPDCRQRNDTVVIDFKAAKNYASLSHVPLDGQERSASLQHTKVASSLPRTGSICTSDHGQGTSSQLSPQGTDSTPASSSINLNYGLYAKSDGIDALCTGLDYQQFQLPSMQPEVSSRKPSYARTTTVTIHDAGINAYNLTQAPQTASIGPLVTSIPVADAFETSDHVSFAAAPISALDAPTSEALELQGHPLRQPIAITRNSLPVTTSSSYVPTLSGAPYPLSATDSQRKQETSIPTMIDAWVPRSQDASFANNTQWAAVDLASCPMSLLGGEVLSEPAHFAAETEVYDWLSSDKISSLSSTHDLSVVATNQYADPYTQISSGVFSQYGTLEDPITRPLTQHHLMAFDSVQQRLHNHLL